MVESPAQPVEGTFDFDLFIIGAGSGGVRAARMAAQRGHRVAVAEAAALGGTCVNLGCIPKKLYSYAAGYAEAFEESRGYGWDVGQPVLDWERLKGARAAQIAQLNDVYRRLLHNAGALVLNGWASLVDPHHVQIGDKRYSARFILLATGATPRVPELPGKELAVTSDAMFDLPRLPGRLVVVGAGYIACEFASIFNGLGSAVTLLHRGASLLSGFDTDVQRVITTEMARAGIDIRLNQRVQAIRRSSNGVLEVFTDSGALIDADVVLFATGRVPNVSGLGLDRVGLKLSSNGTVPVDANYRTVVPSIYALGDISSSLQLTPVALAEAMALVEHLFGDGYRKVDYDFVPTAVFTHPNIGTVGLSEALARGRHGSPNIEIYRSEFKALRHTLSASEERTMVKLVVDRRTDRVLGLHLVGPDAGEIVQGFAVAMRAGATKALFDSTIGVHPTIAEELVTLRTAVAPEQG